MANMNWIRLTFPRWLNIRLREQRVLIIGSGDLAKQIGTEIYNHKELGLKLVGFIDNDPAMLGKSIINPGVIGNQNDIASIVNSERIDEIIVALSDRRAKLPMSVLLDCKLHGVSIEEEATFLERMGGKVLLENLKPSWMVFSEGFKHFGYKKILKRVLDLFFATTGIILTLPVLLITAVLIKLDSKGPIIFKQERVGENGKEFEIYKFRSMKVDAETGTGPVWAGATDDRITRVGRIIRKLRIDELPQLVNVIKGDMSFVGPRPERPFFVKQLRKEIPFYDIRNVVKPGITGWAQINYPYGADMHDAMEKLQYDIWYIKNMSGFLDVMIVLGTFKVVLTGKGAR